MLVWDRTEACAPRIGAEWVRPGLRSGHKCGYGIIGLTGVVPLCRPIYRRGRVALERRSSFGTLELLVYFVLIMNFFSGFHSLSVMVRNPNVIVNWFSKTVCLCNLNRQLNWISGTSLHSRCEETIRLVMRYYEWQRFEIHQSILDWLLEQMDTKLSTIDWWVSKENKWYSQRVFLAHPHHKWRRLSWF